MRAVMRRARVIEVSNDLPARPRGVADDSTAQVFGGCVKQGGACKSPQDCCRVYVPNGGYVLCYFYRGHGDFVAGYCTTSYAQYGGD